MSVGSPADSSGCDTNTCSYTLPVMPNSADRQRDLLTALLEAHPRLFETGELGDRFPEADSSIRCLLEDGLATRLGDLIGASRAAVRFDALRGG